MADLEIGTILNLKALGINSSGEVVQIIHEGNQLKRVAVSKGLGKIVYWLTKEEVEKCLLKN